MCPYETVAYGFSRFCDLFTWEEWVGFGYSIDLAFAGNDAFQAATGVRWLCGSPQTKANRTNRGRWVSDTSKRSSHA